MLDPGKYKSRPRVPEPAGDGSPAHPKWQVGEQEFEALMRMLDNLVTKNKEGEKSLVWRRGSGSVQSLNFAHPKLMLCLAVSRATGQAILTAAQHCGTKVKSTVTWRTLPLPTVVTHTGRIVTQALAPR